MAICEACGIEFRRRSDHRGRFCSVACYHAFRRREADAPGPRRCSRCGESKPEEEFYSYRDRTGRPRRMAKCRACQGVVARAWAIRNSEAKRRHDASYSARTRERRRFRRRCSEYGLDDVDLLALEASSAGLCLICREFIGDDLHVDHDHATGAVRGLLCSPCNVGLGAFRDDPARLLRAAMYLRVTASR